MLSRLDVADQTVVVTARTLFGHDRCFRNGSYL